MLKNKSRVLFLYILAFVTLSVAILIPHFQKLQFSEEIQTKNFKSELVNKEIELDKSLRSINNLVEENIVEDSETPVLEIEEMIPANTSILIYKSDSLIYWSDNSIPVSSKFNENEFSERALKILNGWYDIRILESKSYSFVGLIQIKNEYPYQNQFLKNHFSPTFSLLNNVEISDEVGINEIHNSDGEFLFSLNFPQKFVLNNQIYLIVAFLYFIFYFFLIAALYNTYLLLRERVKYKNLLVLGFVVDIVLLRFLLQYFQIPNILYESELFSPGLYASSILFPSLGDMLANLISLLVIAYAIYNNATFNLRKIAMLPGQKFGRAFLVLLYIFLLFQLLYTLQNDIVLNSSFSLNLSEINSINVYSILGLICFGILVISFIFLTLKAILYLVTILNSLFEYIIAVTLSIVIFFFVCNQFLGCFGLHLIFLYIYILSFWIVFKSKSINIQFSSTLFYILLFSVFSTYILFNTNKYKEHEYRKLAVSNLSTHKDPVTEYKFIEIYNNIIIDSTLNDLLNDYSEMNQEDAVSYIKANYFKGFWLKYDLLVTICDTSKLLDIQAEDLMINCFQYFNQSVNDYGVQTDCENLFYLDYDYMDDHYIGIIDFTEKELPIRIFIEVFPKNIPKGLGYPELLIDQATSNPLNWSVYSYARYENNELAYRYGKYFYSMFLDENLQLNNPDTFFNYDGYSHISCQVNNNTVLVISKQNPSLLDIVAPFSYISIFYGLMIFLIYLIIKSPVKLRISTFGFKKQLQFSVTMLITVSFLFVGVGSLFYIISLNTNKNYSILSEKTHSVLIELEHKLAAKSSLSPEEEISLLGLFVQVFIGVFFRY